MICGSKENIGKVTGLFLDDPKLIVPIQSDHKAHWCVNRLSFAYIFNIRTHQELMLGFNHNDLDRLNHDVILPFLRKDTYCFKKKCLYGMVGWENLLDIEMVYWYQTNRRFNFDVDSTVKRYWADFREHSNVNDFIPVMRHLETCRSVKDNIFTQLTSLSPTESLLKYQGISDNLTEIETHGLYVNDN